MKLNEQQLKFLIMLIEAFRDCTPDKTLLKPEEEVLVLLKEELKKPSD